jgi:hypothetical protein
LVSVDKKVAGSKSGARKDVRASGWGKGRPEESSSKSEADSSESPNYNEFSGAHAKVKLHTYIESIHGVAESTEEVKKRRVVELVLVPKRVVLAFVLSVRLSDFLAF